MTADKTLVIDADAHVVESDHTWDYMDPSEKQFRPIPLETREEAGVKLQFWLIDGKVRGFRFPAFSAAELERRSQQVGRKFADSQESRELGNVGLRLEHMDQTGVDVQVLHNTMFIESATDRASVEVALCKSWNCSFTPASSRFPGEWDEIVSRTAPCNPRYGRIRPRGHRHR